MADFRVLGPVEVGVGAARVDAGQPRQRCLLAALLVDVGRTVTAEALMDRVWGAVPPDGARHAMHTYLGRIRALLGELGLPAALVRRSGGYLLDIDPDRVDLHRFRRLVELSRRPRTTAAEQVALLGEALSLYRGEPLTGVVGPWPDRVRDGFRGERLDAEVRWGQAELRVGDPGSVIGRLTELTVEYPLAEPLAATLMQALAAAGRMAEALDCYAAIRKRLVDELGTEPGAELQAVHQAALRGEVRPAPAAPVPTVPAQLPMGVPGFAGRAEELATLDALLATAGEQPAAVVVTALSGTPGVGKTALAVHWAHRVARRFPDGQLYVNLRGFDPAGPAMTPAEALRGFLDALEVPRDRIPAGPEALAALYRSVLAGRRILVLLDNARDAEQVRPLLPGGPPALVVVTSRNQLPGLVAAEGAYPLALDLLPDAEARELLARRIGPHRVAAERAAVDEIVDRCARLPLALAIVASRAMTTDFTLGTLAGELRRARSALDALDAGDTATDVRAVFSWSYRAQGAAAARLFRLLGLHPGPHAGTAAAASLAGLPPARVRPLLAELSRAHLVTETAPGRYALHDLLRAYATELTAAVDTEDERRAALRRTVDHYLHTAYGADRLLNPNRDPITPGEPEPGVTAEPLAGPDRAKAWFVAEYAAALAVQQRAAAAGLDTHTWQLAWSLAEFLDRSANWADLAAVWNTGLAAADRLADPEARIRARRGLGMAYAKLGRYDEAQTHLLPIVDLLTEVGDTVGLANTHVNLAWLLERQGHLDAALRHAERSVELYRDADHRAGLSRSLNAVGWCHALLGNHRETLVHCGQALDLLREIGDRQGEAAAWDSLGYAHFHLGDPDEAAACYGRALDLYRGVDDRFNEGEVLIHLGDLHLAGGRPGEAEAAWRRALTLLETIGHPLADEVRHRLRPMIRR